MSTDLKLDQMISSWLEAEAPRQLPDRVLRTTFERTRNVRQQGDWRSFPTRLRLGRMMSAVAAVAIIAVIGAAGLGPLFNGAGIGNLPTATTSPTPSGQELPANGSAVEAGSYGATVDGYRYTFRVPKAGWIANVVPQATAQSDDPPNFADVELTLGAVANDPPDLAGFALWGNVPYVYSADPPCSQVFSFSQPGSTADALATAIAGLDGFTSSEPTDVTIGRYQGKSLQLTAPRPANFNDCRTGDRWVRSFSDVHEKDRLYERPDQVDDIWTLDLDNGDRQLFLITYFPTTPPERVDELRQIVETIEISPIEGREPAPTTPPAAWVGSWEATDIGLDRSNQSMDIVAQQDGTYELTVHDDSATVCNGAASTLTGVATAGQPGTIVIARPGFTCDDDSPPLAAGGLPIEGSMQDLSFSYHSERNTVTDSLGLTWIRAAGQAPEPTIPPGVLAGNWTAIDGPPDNSRLTMEVKSQDDGTYELTMRDDGASVCSGAPSTMTAVAAPGESGVLALTEHEFTCDDDTTPVALSGPPLDVTLSKLTFAYDLARDILTDSLGLVWSRGPAPNDGHAPGPYLLWRGGGLPDVHITIPASGWYGEEGNGILVKHENADAPDGLGMIGPFVGDLYVPSDPCRWESTMPAEPATTVDQFVAAVEAQAMREASVPVDITVDGHAGKSITLHVPDDVLFTACDDGVTVFSNEGQFCTLGQDDGTDCDRYHQDLGQIDELLILDVDGVLQVIDGAYYVGTPATEVAEMHAIFDSITFGESPAPTSEPAAFAGDWEATDDPPDSSHLTMAIIAQPDGTYELTIRDDLASVCSGAPSTMTGVAAADESGSIAIARPDYTCDDGAEAQALSGPPLLRQLRGLGFTYDASFDALRDSLGLVWSRVPAGS